MNFDSREFDKLTRQAAEMMSDIGDVPILLRSRLGEHHRISRAADEMLTGIETLVRELRSFDASAAKPFIDKAFIDQDAGETDFVVS